MPKVSKEVSALSFMLSQLTFPETEIKYSDVSAAILGLMHRGLDLSPLASKMIKLLALPYPPFKRIVCDYLIRYSSKISNLSMLATNCFFKDFEDPNPFVRKLVIKTTCRIPCLHDLAYQLLPSALCDSSSYVRCAAATSCSLVLNESNLDSNQNTIDKLYEMIRDPEPSVVCCSLTSLNEILRSEGGIVINSKLARYLVARISDFHDWNFSAVCIVLKKYVPKDNEELLLFLNALDQSLLESKPIIFLLAADLALYYVSQLNEKFSKDIIKQITPQLKLLINHSSSEMLGEVLEIIEKYLPDHKESFSSFYSLFLCCFCDTPNVKIKKLRIIVHFANDSNSCDIAEELLMHCTNNVEEVSVQAVQSFIALVQLQLRVIPQALMNTFVQLLDIQDSILSEEILNALSSVNLNEVVEFKEMLLPLLSKYSNDVLSFKGKHSLLKIIKDYGSEIANAPYIIEQFVNDMDCIESESLMIALMKASVKLFLERPQEMQLLLGQILQFAQESNCLLLRKRSAIYYYLLQEFSKTDAPLESSKHFKDMFEKLDNLYIR
ncbi:AP-4 complex subunit beta-1-like isoform X1 [Uloborus diversus]|uniref:AP-4 complex subunit beta-1-like isoform X1 n=1 Tax=Uloborus diversus TaxID=327109 RepID=UPI002409E84A|nr:AP-4 complex subunit beta-1-like isoform X1 [Uloborus diversus]XP_054720200.1 AP-4 complex subunit beta-1-like isoform X1 [Uloborus diversus]